MVLDKIRTDVKYYNLITYGLEGYHYDLINDGKNIRDSFQIRRMQRK